MTFANNGKADYKRDRWFLRRREKEPIVHYAESAIRAEWIAAELLTEMQQEPRLRVMTQSSP